MAIDWSGYQIPGYLAAQDMRQVGHEAGSAIGALMDKGLSRQELETKNLGEGLRGQGRSYYEDSVDKSQFKDYGNWVQDEGGRYLQAAESGRNFRNVGGNYQLQSDDGAWNSLGTKNEDGVWDPYNTLNADGTKSEMTPFETHQQKNFMDDWSGGTYNYLSPQSAMKALFSKERYRPTSNIYQDAGSAGTQQRAASGQGTGNFSTPGTKGSLGWHPGSILAKIIGGKGKSKKPPVQPPVQPAVVPAGGGSITPTGLNPQNSAGYWFTPKRGGARTPISAKLSFELQGKNVDAAQFEEEYNAYLNAPAQWSKQLSPEEWAKKQYGI